MAKVGRNDPCPCGSGRKYKKCCLLAAAGGKPAPLGLRADFPLSFRAGVAPETIVVKDMTLITTEPFRSRFCDAAGASRDQVVRILRHVHAFVETIGALRPVPVHAVLDYSEETAKAIAASHGDELPSPGIQWNVDPFELSYPPNSPHRRTWKVGQLIVLSPSGIRRFCDGKFPELLPERHLGTLAHEMAHALGITAGTPYGAGRPRAQLDLLAESIAFRTVLRESPRDDLYRAFPPLDRYAAEQRGKADNETVLEHTTDILLAMRAA